MESSAWERRKKTGANIDGALSVYMLQTSAFSPRCILGATWYCGVSSSATCWPNGTGFKTCWVCQRASLTLQGLPLLYMLVLRTAGATLRTQLNPESKAPLLPRWETQLPKTWASCWGWGGDLGRLSPWHASLSCHGVRGLGVFRDQANDIKEGCVGKPCPPKWMWKLPPDEQLGLTLNRRLQHVMMAGNVHLTESGIQSPPLICGKNSVILQYPFPSPIPHDSLWLNYINLSLIL